MTFGTHVRYLFMILNILYFIAFGYATYIGISNGLKMISDTRTGLVPPCVPDKSQDYFFLVYHD